MKESFSSIETSQLARQLSLTFIVKNVAGSADDLQQL